MSRERRVDCRVNMDTDNDEDITAVMHFWYEEATICWTTGEIREAACGEQRID